MLVSFCLTCYNQEKYIKETLTAALAQDYSPLEIIVSDDCSPDHTWEIIQEIVSTYSGPHKIILNRNTCNLGNIGNWEKLCSLAHGEILIKADGDDVSLPQRTRMIVQDYLESGQKALLMTSSYLKIDESGKITGEKKLDGGWDKRSVLEMAWGKDFTYLGATSAFSRRLFTDFQKIKFLKATDDSVYEARGLLCKESNISDNYLPFRIVSEPLVKYRVGSGLTTGGKIRVSMLRGATMCMEARKQTLYDMESTAKGYMAQDIYNRLFNFYKDSLCHQENLCKLLSDKSIIKRWKSFLTLYHESRKINIAIMIDFIFVFPTFIGDSIFSILKLIKH